MDISSFYIEIGGDYNDVLARLVNERLIKKYILRFVDDEAFSMMCNGYNNKQAEVVFRGAHTLKGLCSTLGFDNLYKSSSELTEALRYKTEIDFTLCEPLYKKVVDDYDFVIKKIKKFNQNNI